MIPISLSTVVPFPLAFLHVSVIPFVRVLNTSDSEGARHDRGKSISRVPKNYHELPVQRVARIQPSIQEDSKLLVAGGCERFSSVSFQGREGL